MPSQRSQTVEDGYSQWKLPRMRRGSDHDRAKDADPDPSSEEKSMPPTNPHFASKPHTYDASPMSIGLICCVQNNGDSEGGTPDGW